MKVLRIYNQFRRDCDADLECEGCGNKETEKDAYDDRNYWDDVIPARKCKNCNKSAKDLGSEIKKIQTKYPENYQV